MPRIWRSRCSISANSLAINNLSEWADYFRADAVTALGGPEHHSHICDHLCRRMFLQVRSLRSSLRAQGSPDYQPFHERPATGCSLRWGKVRQTGGRAAALAVHDG